jgi:hypothetical protein
MTVLLIVIAVLVGWAITLAVGLWVLAAYARWRDVPAELAEREVAEHARPAGSVHLLADHRNRKDVA